MSSNNEEETNFGGKSGKLNRRPLSTIGVFNKLRMRRKTRLTHLLNILSLGNYRLLVDVAVLKTFFVNIRLDRQKQKSQMNHWQPVMFYFAHRQSVQEDMYRGCTVKDTARLNIL